jgi:hypothetical protein
LFIRPFCLAGDRSVHFHLPQERLMPVKSQLAILTFAVFSMGACSDSTGPTALGSKSALQSLALGVPSVSYGAALYQSLLIPESLGGIEPFVNKVVVGIDGASQPMYALALHESFEPGACLETIFAHSPHDTGCILPALGVAVVLWQSRSANAPPDRVVVLLSDVGTSDFGFYPDTTTHSEFALYALSEGEDWAYFSGALTSSVTATTVSCGSPLPPFAKQGTCSSAGFDLEGSITFTRVDVPAGTLQTLTIPRLTIHGLSMSISEVQPVDPNRIGCAPSC